MELTNELLQTIISPYKERIDALENKLKDCNNQPASFKSPAINEIAGALAKAQGEIKTAELNKQNPFFKSRYADLASIVNAARPALSKHGLSVVQNIITTEDGANLLKTILMHTSGQFIESTMRIIPPKNDIQTISSYTTYLKRLTYASLIGVVTGDEDDDGEISMEVARNKDAKGTSLNTKYDPKESSPEVISKDQMDEINYELQEYPDIAEQILDGFQIRSLSDIPKQKYQPAINRIRAIKNLRNGIK